MDYQKLIETRNKQNKFDHNVGIEITEIRKGYARGKVDIGEKHINFIGSVHGGLSFSLADTVGGAAAVSHGELVTTVSANINFLAPAIGVEKLAAEATEVKHGRNISVYDVRVFDENERMIAQGNFSYYSMKIPVDTELYDL